MDPDTEPSVENPTESTVYTALLTASTSSKKGSYVGSADHGSADHGSAHGTHSSGSSRNSNKESIKRSIENSIGSSYSMKNPSYERVRAKAYDADILGNSSDTITRRSRRVCWLTSLLSIFVMTTLVLVISGGRRQPPKLAPKLATVSDYEEYAKQNLDPNAWLYYSSGATQEVTLRDNVAAYGRIRIHPDRQNDVSEVESSLRKTTFGGNISMPIGFAPTACHWWATEAREIATVRAAKALNTVMIVSIDSSTITDDLAKAEPDAILWQQMYIFGDVKDTLYMVHLAERSNCKAIVLTIDKPAATLRYPEMRGQLVYPPEFPFGANYPPDMAPTSGYAKKRDWNDVSWLVNQTKLPVIVKGVLTGKEAKKAVEMGASGIIVSNHGGRALDGVPATIDQLAEVVAAVEGKVPVYLDGGIRTGMDVFKALALGADMVFVGRASLWGLAHSGQAGAEAIFDILKTELVNTMQLAGARNLTDVTALFVYQQQFCTSN